MSGDAWLVRALVACYPPAWRRRYGAEYAELLRELGVRRRPGLIVDSLGGAARAYGGVIMRSASPMTLVVWACGLFTVAGIGFAKLAEDSTSQARGFYGLLVAAAAVALLALVAAAVPSAVALLRGRDVESWRYVAVPVLGAAVWYAVLRLALLMTSGHGVHSGASVIGFLLIAVSGIAVVAATAWAADRVLRRVAAPQPRRLRGLAMITTAVGMAVATGAALAWGLQVRAADPVGFSGDNGILATPFVPSWTAVVLASAIATGLVAIAARRQWEATD